MNDIIKLLPSVDALLSRPEIATLCRTYRRDFVRDACRLALQAFRRRITGGESFDVSDKEEMAQRVSDQLFLNVQQWAAPHLKKVINATGIVLHTGLGRAPLSKAAQENVNRVLQGYCNLELDMDTGKRGERTDHVRDLLRHLTGSEDSLLVNNNAAAVFLSLNTLAFGQEAIISRGQLIEIGGSFRMPDVMEKSGVIMREVGTTNKTKLADYERAITPNTGAIVVAHTSNYKVVGFTQQVELQQLCELAHAHQLPVLHDLGAGVILDLQSMGLPYEPTVQDSLNAGADVITFSGDKVLGGPQAGLIVGRSEWLKKIHKNPLMRAVRCDKMVYAAMEATLRLYFRNDLLKHHTVMQMLSEAVGSVKQRAQRILDQLDESVKQAFEITIEPSIGQFGSGALPLETLSSYALVLMPSNQNAERLMRRLRHGDPPVVGYIQDDRLWLDVRTVRENEISDIASVLNQLAP